MKKFFIAFFSLFFILAFIFSSSAKPIALENARKVANTKIELQKKFWKWQDRSISNSHELKKNGKKLAYVFELEPEGCIAISPDSDLSPVIAFTDKGKFSLEDSPDNVFLIILKKDMENRISALAELSKQEKAKNTALWSDYIAEDESTQQILGDEGVWGPWLTTTWHQGFPYNQYCPIDPVTGNRSIVGCVATATAQICNYWQYPTTASFNWADDHYISREGTSRQVRIDEDYIIRDFLSFTELNGKLEVIDYSDLDDIYALNFACGVTVEMMYSSGGSGAYTDVPTYQKFGYNFAFVDGNSPYFYGMLKESMKSAEPAQLSIIDVDNNTGHSIVADGFRTSWNGKTGDYYHLNFGWGPNSPTLIQNCWYLLPTGLPSGYDLIQDGTLNIHPPRDPVIIFVSTTGNDIDGNGSEANPYRTIQRGINRASSGDTVIVLDGTYTGAGNVNLDFMGKGINVRSLNGPENCIIDCQNSATTRAFVFNNGEGNDSMVSGFTIKRGNNDRGGGIRCHYSSPIITGNIFTDNVATVYGGAIYCFQSSAVISNNTFTNNAAPSGGAVFCHTSSTNIIGNSFIGNSTTSSSSGGGAIYCFQSPTTKIDRNVIRGNTARFGAGILLDSTALTMTNNLISNNTAQASGGGIYVMLSYPLTLINCTFADNKAMSFGCGIYTSNSEVVIKNSIFWNVTREVYLGNSKDKVTVTYSDIRDGTSGITGSGTKVWGAGNISSDPLFVNPATRDYRLQNTSPCLGTGTNTGAPTNDLEGNPRPNPEGSNCDMGTYEDKRSEISSIITLNLSYGWNMISCPGIPVEDDMIKITEGKNMPSVAYFYNTSSGAYQATTTLEFGKGYYVAALENLQLAIEYYPRNSLTIPMAYGWNIIGGPSCSIPTNSIATDPAGKAINVAYYWDNVLKSYTPSYSIDPGKGYFLAVLANCTLTMDCAIPSPPSFEVISKKQPSWEGIISINTQKNDFELTFGTHELASDNFDIAFDEPVPPIPDFIGGSKVGWVNGKCKSFELLRKSIIKDGSDLSWVLSIELLEEGIVEWRNLPETYHFTLLHDDNQLDMNQNKNLHLPPGKYDIKILSSRGDALPKKTALLENYPNPFNPETWIPYELSKETNVEIAIYSSTGKLVRKLDLGHKPAGSYIIRPKAAYWDGKNESGESVSSGIYFYTLITPEISQTRKLLIIR